MNELLIAGGVIGLVYYTGSQPIMDRNDSDKAGHAITAAMQTLLGKRPLAGVSWSQDPGSPLSATANYNQMRGALVGQYGQIATPLLSQPIPRLTQAQLVEVATAWLAAYDRGRIVDRQNFAFIPEEADASFASSGSALSAARNTCAETTSADRTSLGDAACDLASYRDYVKGGGADVTVLVVEGTITLEMFRRINRLAVEMDGADYVNAGLRNSEQGWKWEDIPGGIGAAASASVSFVEDVAGKAASALGGAIVGSDLFWLAGLGFAAYLVLR